MFQKNTIEKKWLKLAPTTRGAIWMLASGIFFAGLGVSIRLASREIPSVEVVFFRNFINLIIMLPWLIKIGIGGLKTKKLSMHLFRAIGGLISMFFWFAGFGVLPLAEATSLGFTAPLFATLGAVFFLHEIVRFRRWFAILFGFIGTLIILRPGLQIITPEALYILIGAIFVAGGFMLVKILSKTESPTTMVLFMALFLTPLSLIPALFVWVWPSPEAWIWLIIVGTTATCGHLLFNRAFAVTDVTAVLPFDYCRLIFAAGIGLFMFNEMPDMWTWIGGSVIFSSTIYIANRESKKTGNISKIKTSTDEEVR
jgi:drug/metabolite transporter (DMT)-like permease